MLAENPLQKKHSINFSFMFDFTEKQWKNIHLNPTVSFSLCFSIIFQTSIPKKLLG
jgi:hypothetical protein